MTGQQLTIADPLPVGAWIRIDGEQLLRVVACTGRGPFTVTVCPVTRWRRVLARVRAQTRRPHEWWLNTRCLPDRGWCWRRAKADSLCDRHWLRAVEHGDDL